MRKKMMRHNRSHVLLHRPCAGTIFFVIGETMSKLCTAKSKWVAEIEAFFEKAAAGEVGR